MNNALSDDDRCDAFIGLVSDNLSERMKNVPVANTEFFSSEQVPKV